MSVACDENKYLTKFHLKSELNQTWYNYRCCSVNYFGDSDIHPHEELASWSKPDIFQILLSAKIQNFFLYCYIKSLLNDKFFYNVQKKLALEQ